MNKSKVTTKSVSLKPPSALLFIEMVTIQLFYDSLITVFIIISSVGQIKKLNRLHKAPGP